jgi:hypothetical protein
MHTLEQFIRLQANTANICRHQQLTSSCQVTDLPGMLCCRAAAAALAGDGLGKTDTGGVLAADPELGVVSAAAAAAGEVWSPVLRRRCSRVDLSHATDTCSAALLLAAPFRGSRMLRGSVLGSSCRAGR